MNSRLEKIPVGFYHVVVLVVCEGESKLLGIFSSRDKADLACSEWLALPEEEAWAALEESPFQVTENWQWALNLATHAERLYVGLPGEVFEKETVLLSPPALSEPELATICREVPSPIVLTLSIASQQSGHPTQALGRLPPREAGGADLRQILYAADHGCADAQACLGGMCEAGKGVPQDFELAARYYRMAAEQGHVLAQGGLGCLYNKGLGVPLDHGQAAQWFRKAAEQGEPTCQFNLGLWYGKGKGVPPSDEESFHWYLLSAQQGHPRAQHKVGLAYAQGRGVEQELTLARDWLSRAVESGEARAQANLDSLSLLEAAQETD